MGGGKGRGSEVHADHCKPNFVLVLRLNIPRFLIQIGHYFSERQSSSRGWMNPIFLAAVICEEQAASLTIHMPQILPDQLVLQRPFEIIQAPATIGNLNFCNGLLIAADGREPYVRLL
jgi:hypothetical protein